MKRKRVVAAPVRRASPRIRLREGLFRGIMIWGIMICLVGVAHLTAEARPNRQIGTDVRGHEKESRITLASGPGVDMETVESLARLATRLDVLGQSAQSLRGHPGARLNGPPGGHENRPMPGFSEEELLRALASAVFPVVMEAAPSAGSVTAVARLRPSARNSGRNLGRALHAALRQDDNLDLRLDGLRRMDGIVREGLELLRRSAALSLPAAGHNPFASRLQALGQEAAAMETWLEALNDFDHTWRHPDEALILLEKLARLAPRSPLVWLGLGEALILLERPFDAMEALRTATSLPDSPARAFYMRGIAHLRLHLPTNAVEDFSQALSLRPDKAAWWRARGAARLVAEEGEGVCPDFYQACVLGDCEGLHESRKRGLCLDKR